MGNPEAELKETEGQEKSVEPLPTAQPDKARGPQLGEVLEFMRLTDENITQYREYESSRLVFQITFTLMYVGFALVLLLAALWIGIALANRFVDPIRIGRDHAR